MSVGRKAVQCLRKANVQVTNDNIIIHACIHIEEVKMGEQGQGDQSSLITQFPHVHDKFTCSERYG